MTELIDNPPPLPEGKAVVRGPVSAFKDPESGTLVDFDCEGPLAHCPEDGDELFTADQYRAGEAAAFARGVAAGRNAGLDRIDRLEAENEAQRKLLERAHTILELVEPNHCVTEAITQHLKGTP